VLERIADLAIPPAWREVWICMDPRGHLQATGFDAAARKQYLYHERWREHRDRAKFDSMLAFGTSLPRLRRRVARDLAPTRHTRSGGGGRGGGSSEGGGSARPGPGRKARAAIEAGPGPKDLTRGRVLACSVRLLDLGFFRIGSEDYAERNESYGLTTMLREHVAVGESHLVFDFPAKSGRRRVQEIADRDALALVAALKRRRSGSQLLAYREAGRWIELHAEGVNDYIKQHSDGEFTAKDFRTWNATVLAAVALAVAEAHESRPRSRARRERTVVEAVKTVSVYLGNTPAVCRASYVDPRVIDRFHAGTTIVEALPAGSPAGGPDLADARVRRRVESAVLELLGDAGGQAAKAA
jgi:DNA topoisomerase I